MDKAKLAKLDRAFNPKVAVVVGAKKENNYSFLRAISTIKGSHYSVQIDPNEIPGIEAMGIKNFASLMDIPEPVDYVIVAVPRGVTPRVVADCIKKDVAGVTLFSSGFAETQTEEGIRLSKVITDMATEADLNLIGPNCMGLFNPRLGLRFGAEQYYDESGPVGFISQSGSNASAFIQAGHVNGVLASKVVSFGNGYVLEAVDYLEYLAQDPETEIIGAYLEGVRRWEPFYKLLKEVTRKKPVIIWKGGQTGAGARMTSSHTGSMASDYAIWNAAMRQAGVIQAANMDELVDIAKALIYLGPTTAQRVGCTGGAGGQSVAIADAFAKAGLEIPVLSQKSLDTIASFFVLVGASFNNPIDMGQNRREFITIMDLLKDDENIDAVVMQMSFVLGLRDSRRLEETLETIIDFRETSNKPLMVVSPSYYPPEQAQEVHALTMRLQEHRIPSFSSHDKAAVALKKVSDYYRFLGERD